MSLNQTSGYLKYIGKEGFLMGDCGCNNGGFGGFDFDMILWVLIIIVIVSFMNNGNCCCN